MIPLAMMVQSTMPPKMLTRMTCTWGSDVMILNACVTYANDQNGFKFLSDTGNRLTVASEAPPPTSRKLAGVPPCSLMMSMVAMARPAPFTAMV